MSMPKGPSNLLTWAFVPDRLDIWVLKGSIVFILVCIVGLVLWHLGASLLGKRPRKIVRHSPEPPSPVPSPKLLPRVRAQADVIACRDDPEQLQQACTDLEESLAEGYKELAESWLRKGQPQRAAAALKKILRIYPDGHQAKVTQERLQQIGNLVEDDHA
jgi:hypothetical protein